MERMTEKQRDIREILRRAEGQYLTPQEIGRRMGRSARDAYGYAMSALKALEKKGVAVRGQAENGAHAWAITKEAS